MLLSTAIIINECEVVERGLWRCLEEKHCLHNGREPVMYMKPDSTARPKLLIHLNTVTTGRINEIPRQPNLRRVNDNNV